MPRLYGMMPDGRRQRRDAKAALALAFENSFHLSQMV